ncbi:centrosomal protein of 95 kDa-like isoform X2 [Scomber scombrus]|uniref:centrosomal protein of 95 kDa-like isoform X2 n=1 Tax=Scomber scombrus TaxID=13677 RepID=UPI002DDC6C16|nr:centrosomal protein of 95 kDa-like isoform X2 [Scomber scombrus]
MGTPEGERDWVDVANDLLSKCHINLRLRKLTDCDANVFIALYEAIFGEKVPDYIESPCSQEDDIHNVQSVIDSLSLDYLQISLSHITGENVVRGNEESVKNILEIFDGLLEYLNEEISEELQNEELNDSFNEEVLCETKEPTNCDGTEQKETKLDGACLSSSGESTIQSSKHSLHSWNAEEIGSTSDHIGLGVSARTFTTKQEGLALPPQTSDALTTSGPLDTQDAPLAELPHSAIALQPPNQSNTPHRPDTDPHSLSQSPTAAGLNHEHAEEEAEPVTTETSRPVAETVVTNGLQSPPLCHSTAVSEKSLSSQQRARTGAEGETLEPTNGGPRRVLFRTQPDVLFLTLQDEMGATTPSPPDTEEEEDLSYTQRRHEKRTGHTDKTGFRSSRLEEEEEEEGFEEPLSYRRQRNRQAEEELHHISEKLSHRLEELDQMLKRVLDESGESSEVREEDKQSHHSDSIMECRRTPRQHTVSGIPDPESTHRTRSLSPSPPRVRRSLQVQLEDAMKEALSMDDGRQTNLTASDHTCRELHHRPSHRKHSKYLVNTAYEEELKIYEGKKQADLDKARLRAQEAEQEYREAILRDVSQAPRLSPAKMKAQHKTQRNPQTTPGRRKETPRKAPPMKVKENELLPVLLDELPHLHISPHTLGRMWEQQMQQVDRLHTLSSSHSKRRGKLSSQVEEAQRKHDLLVEIVQKDQDHKRRLRDFKERIQQQKSTQNRLREQRQQTARAKKYHNDYHVQHRARLMKARTKEERMFRQLFEEGLELQKVRLREQRANAREQRLEHQRRHQDQIKSLENYYKDQFSLLAEKLAHERQDIQVRKKAQEKALLKMKRELRSRMEREIGELQEIIIQNDEDDYFQDLEVQRLRNRVQMASFQYNTSYMH